MHMNACFDILVIIIRMLLCDKSRKLAALDKKHNAAACQSPERRCQVHQNEDRHAEGQSNAVDT
jgi:hypothetical protein